MTTITAHVTRPQAILLRPFHPPPPLLPIPGDTEE